MTTVFQVKNKKTWESFVLNNKEGNFLQSWNWGRFHQQIGNKIFRLGFKRNNRLEGISLLIKQEAKRGIYLECPGGPLLNWHKPVIFEEFIKEIKKRASQENCSFIRIRPQLRDNLFNKKLFQRQGFISAPMHLHAENTWQLDLTKTKDQLWKEMRKNNRQLINKAQELGVQVKESRKAGDIDLLYKLQMEAVGRHHFVPFPKKYFYHQFKTFTSDNQAAIFKAVYREKVLSAALIIFYGQSAVYHYSGSSSDYWQIPDSYLLQWAVINKAKERGHRFYNFWGIAPTSDPNHRFAGVTIFKKGFGGFPVSYLPAQDLPLTCFYWPVYLFENIRKACRSL